MNDENFLFGKEDIPKTIRIKDRKKDEGLEIEGLDKPQMSLNISFSESSKTLLKTNNRNVTFTLKVGQNIKCLCIMREKERKRE